MSILTAQRGHVTGAGMKHIRRRIIVALILFVGTPALAIFCAYTWERGPEAPRPPPDEGPAVAIPCTFVLDHSDWLQVGDCKNTCAHGPPTCLPKPRRGMRIVHGARLDGYCECRSAAQWRQDSRMWTADGGRTELGQHVDACRDLRWDAGETDEVRRCFADVERALDADDGGDDRNLNHDGGPP